MKYSQRYLDFLAENNIKVEEGVMAFNQDIYIKIWPVFYKTLELNIKGVLRLNFREWENYFRDRPDVESFNPSKFMKEAYQHNRVELLSDLIIKEYSFKSLNADNLGEIVVCLHSFIEILKKYEICEQTLELMTIEYENIYFKNLTKISSTIALEPLDLVELISLFLSKIGIKCINLIAV